MQDMNQSLDIKLHDIKTIMPIDEYSFFYFMVLMIIAIILLLGIAYLLYRWFKKRNRFNIRKEHYKIIKTLNLSDTKQTAYLITSVGATFKDDSPRHLEMYNNLTTRLQKYKYKKEVERFDKEILGYIEVYKEMIDA